MRTAEWVTPKHPDKMCDQISDAILDFCLQKDSNARVAIEVMGGHGKVKIIGEITMNGEIKYPEIETIVYRVTGDTNLDVGTTIVKQSHEIANGVDTGGAGDQGIMRGYACDENEDMIPQTLWYARSLGMYIYNQHPYDGKTQITLDEDDKIETIVASFQNTTKEQLSFCIGSWISENFLENEIKGRVVIHCNPAGDWNQGGFDADTGLTGRKLIVDNYGPEIAIGGGAFSGKDATKVDRSAAYMARKIATDFVRSEKEHGNKKIKVWVDLAYAIGVKMPVMAKVEVDHSTGHTEYNLLKMSHGYDLTPIGIIKHLGLRRPQFEATAKYGHFGMGFTWDNPIKNV